MTSLHLHKHQDDEYGSSHRSYDHDLTRHVSVSQLEAGHVRGDYEYAHSAHVHVLEAELVPLDQLDAHVHVPDAEVIQLHSPQSSLQPPQPLPPPYSPKTGFTDPDPMWTAHESHEHEHEHGLEDEADQGVERGGTSPADLQASLEHHQVQLEFVRSQFQDLAFSLAAEGQDVTAEKRKLELGELFRMHSEALETLHHQQQHVNNDMSSMGSDQKTVDLQHVYSIDSKLQETLGTHGQTEAQVELSVDEKKTGPKNRLRRQSTIKRKKSLAITREAEFKPDLDKI